MSDDQQTCRHCGNSFVMGACGSNVKHWPEYCSSDCMYLAEIARLQVIIRSYGACTECGDTIDRVHGCQCLDDNKPESERKS